MAEYYLMCDDNNIAYGYVDPEFQKQFFEEHGYPCGHYDFDYVIPRVLLRRMKRSAHLWGVGELSVDFIHTELIEWLSPEIHEGVQFGEVEVVGRGVSRTYRSYWPKQKVPLRSEKAYCWRCEVCGQLIYTVMGSQIYLLRRDVPQLSVFRVKFGLVVTAEILERLRTKRLRKVCIDELPVLDEPIDGFPADLNTITKEQERRREPYDYERERRKIRYVEDEPSDELPPGWKYLE